MARCPNKNTEEYKRLEEALGVEGAYAVFLATGEDGPDMDQVEEIINGIQKNYGDFESAVLNPEIDKLSEEIKSAYTPAHPINKVIDDHFTKIQSHLKALRNDNNYAALKKLLSLKGEDGTTLDSTKRILQKAQESIDNVDEVRDRVRAIAAAVLQSSKVLDLMQESLRDVAKTPEDAKENIAKTQSFLHLASTYQDLLDSAYEAFGSVSPPFRRLISTTAEKITNLKRLVLDNDKQGVVHALGSILEPSLQEAKTRIDDMIDKQKVNLAKAIATGNKQWRAEIEEDLKQKQATVDAINSTIVDGGLSFMEGKRGDASKSFYFESFRSSPDPIVSSFAQWFKEGTDAARASYVPGAVSYLRAIGPHVKTLGSSYRLDPGKLKEAITYEEELLSPDGTTYKVLRYLNPFDGAEKALATLKQKVYTLEADVKDPTKVADKDDNQELLYAAQDALDKERTKYWYRKEVQEYHEGLAKLWRDEIGHELKNETNAIWDQVNLIDHYHTVDGYITPEELTRRDDLIRQYTMLANVNNPDGTPKTGDALQKAKRMQEVREFNTKYFTYSTDQELFDTTRNHQVDYLTNFKGYAKTSSEFIKGMEGWDRDNTVTKVTEQFYTDQDLIYTKISAITDGLKKPEGQDEIEKQNEVISSLLKGNRDENNQPIGILIPEKGAERIKAAEEAIYKAKAANRRNNGLTPEQQDRRNKLYEMSRLHEASFEDMQELQGLNDLVKTNGLSKEDRKELENLYAQLEEIRAFMPTEYYIQAHNDLSGKYGVTVDEDAMVFENGKLVPLLNSQTLEDLLDYDDYNNWFHQNHYLIEAFDYENKVQSKAWKRTRQWTKVTPTDEKYFEAVPTKKYAKREFNKEFLTGYDSVTDKVHLEEGVHIDNRGNFLPRETPDNKYRNQKYFDLLKDKSEKGNALSGIHRETVKSSLAAQSEAPTPHKLWYDVPRAPKKTRERVLALENWKRFLPQTRDNIQALWKNERSFTLGTGNAEDEATTGMMPALDSVNSDALAGNIDSTLVPVRYKGSIDIDEVSSDIVASHLGYTYALKLAGKLNEMTPIAKGLRNILEETNAEVQSKYKGLAKYRNRGDKVHTSRIIAIDRLIDKNILGQNKAYEFGKSYDTFVNWLKNLTGFAVLKMNPLITVGNISKWSLENLVEAGNGLFTEKDWAAGVALYPKWQSALVSDYATNDVANVPWQILLDIYMKPKQGVAAEEELGNRMRRMTSRDLLHLDTGNKLTVPLLGLDVVAGVRHHREAADFFTQKCLQLAVMNATKIEQVLPDGSIKLIPYHEAWENDYQGQLKLKDGIDQTWAPTGQKFREFLKRYDAANSRINGFLDSVDQSFLQQYTNYSGAMFLKGWLIATELNHWAGKDARVNKLRLATGTALGAIAGFEYAHHINAAMGMETFAFVSIFLSGAFKFSPRFNLGSGTWIGRHTALMDFVAQKYDANFGKVEMSEAQQGAVNASIKTFGALLGIQLLAAILLGAGTAFAGFAKKYDETNRDEKMIEKDLKEMSYWQKVALYELLRLQSQTATFSSVDQQVSSTSDGAIILSTLNDVMLLISDGLSGVTDKKHEPGISGPPQDVPRYEKSLQNLTGIHALKASLGNEESLERSILSYERQRIRR